MSEIDLDGNLALKEIQKLEGHADRVWSLAWNPATGAGGLPPTLASCSGDKTARIWQQGPSGFWNCTVTFPTRLGAPPLVQKLEASSPLFSSCVLLLTLETFHCRR
ncbi:hypothetical protein M5K25_018813 [Dendrobium thyrsiflorum]|uniref:Uncharacterized protein n=1 Tax=Dendrobium thyrsiflorum TaxID=117978 RepID=A0ABD0UE10_DENTH